MPKKTFSRNEVAQFTAGFYTDKTKSTPIIPISESYPTFAIKSPSGDIIYSGTAIAYSTPGTYRILWTIPNEAQLSTDLDNWVVEWTMVSNNNRQLFYKENFQVVDARVETPTDKSIIQVVPSHKSFRICNYFETDPEEIQLDIYPATNTETPIKTITKDALTGPVNEEGHIGYYTDITEGLAQGDYLVMWSYRNTVLSEVSREFKTLRSIRTTVLRYCDQLRILIDRFQKRLSAPNAYSDSDLIEFLYKGCDSTNQWYPANNPPINWDTVDGLGMGVYVIAWAALWALRSQHLLETDLAFNFCLDWNSYVRTERGLVKIRDLSRRYLEDYNLMDCYKRFISDEYRKIVRIILDRVEDGDYYAEEIVEKAKLSLTGQQLGNRLSNLNLNDFHHTDGKGYWKWSINKEFRKKAIRNSYYKTNKPYKDYYSDYDLDTYLGNQHPQVVFNLGKKKVRRLTTELGNRIRCTTIHPFLVLTPELTFVEKQCKDINVGDYILIDRRAEEDRMWDISFEDIIEKLPKSKTEGKAAYGANSNLVLPTKLTKELARVLGYLDSDGSKDYVGIRFFNKEIELIEDFEKNFYKCFKGVTLERSQHENGTWCTYVNSATISKFLNAIGARSTTSYYIRIPWCIMQAPLRIAKEYIIRFVEGDGCLTDNNLYISSSSPKLREDMQLLLLRFGILSRNKIMKRGIVANLNVRGPSLDIYAEKIGFFRKGKGKHTTFAGSSYVYNKKNTIKNPFYNSHREALPRFVLDYIKDVRKRNQLKRTEWIEFKGKKVRLETSLRNYHGNGSSYLIYEELENYFNARKEHLKLIDKTMYKRIKKILKYKFHFVRVTENVADGKAVVCDPWLQNKNCFLSNYFTACGIVTHNSGQSTTLDYDRTGNLDSAISGLMDFINNGLSKAKTALARSANVGGVGSVFVRPYSIYQNAQNMVIPYSGPLSGIGNSIWNLMVILGL